MPALFEVKDTDEMTRGDRMGAMDTKRRAKARLFCRATYFPNNFLTASTRRNILAERCFSATSTQNSVQIAVRKVV